MESDARNAKEFGFYPQPLQIKAGSVTVSPLPRILSGLLATYSLWMAWKTTGSTLHLNEFVTL